MPAKRSPNCPAHTLDEAIEKAHAIYAEEGRNSFSGARAVTRMGYNGLNGASRRALGAVRGFGLVEGRGSALRVSDDAVLIIADTDAEDQADRQAALLRCLRHNRVFGDLYEHYGRQGAPHELSGFLQKKYHFKPAAADRTAQVFRQSLRVLESRPLSRPVDEGGESPAGSPRRVTEAVYQTGAQGGGNSRDGAEGRQVSSGRGNGAVSGEMSLALAEQLAVAAMGPDYRQDSFALEYGTARLIWPVRMSREEFEDFSDWLFLEHRKIARRVESGLELLKQRESDGSERSQDSRSGRPPDQDS